MPNGFAGLSFCMGKRRPKDINMVDGEDFFAHRAREAALKRQKPPLSLTLSPQAGRGDWFGTRKRLPWCEENWGAILRSGSFC